MSGYTPAFDSIYDGTLYGRWPTAAVWATLIPLIDKHGEINRSYEAIAGMTGWPMELLRQGITELMQPDPGSRTPDEDGRRLILIDAARPWGWRVVNHAHYRERARLMAKNEREVTSGKNAERMATAAHRRSPPLTAAHRLSDANADADKNSSEKKTSPRSTRARKCPGSFEPDRAFALSALPDIDVETEVARFRDHQFRDPKSDWDGTWRNWIRTCKDTGRYARKVARQWE